MDVSEARELFAYDRWAMERLFDAAAGLGREDAVREVGGSYPSVLATLAHMTAAAWIWLERLHGRPSAAPPSDWAPATVPGVRERWAEVAADWDTWLARLEAGGLTQVCAYRRLGGEVVQSEVRHILRHVVNHATYHRGQVVTQLRLLGAQPPTTDFIVWDRERT